MYGCIDLVVQGLKEPLETIIPLAARMGIGGISPSKHMMEDPAYAAYINSMRKDHGLKWGLVPAPIHFLSADEASFEKGLETFKSWADTLCELGIDRCYNHVVPCSQIRPFAENFAFHVERIRKVSTVAESMGMTYALEYVGAHDTYHYYTHPFIHTAAGLLALIEAAGTKTGILYDTFHWFTGSNSDLDDLYLMASHTDKIVCLHVNDGAPGKKYNEQLDLTRELPLTTGVIDAKRFIDTFKEKGYHGPVVCEPLWPAQDRFDAQGIEKTVQELAEAYKRVL